MLAWDCGGGGGFCTFAVLPPHPASNEIIAAAKRKRIHRLVATADLLELSCIIVLVIARPKTSLPALNKPDAPPWTRSWEEIIVPCPADKQIGDCRWLPFPSLISACN